VSSTEHTVTGVELRGDQAAAVRRYLRAGDLTGPIIEVPGPQRREIHLVTGLANAERALAWLREQGVTVHSGGTEPNGPARWAVSPEQARWIPPVVVLAAAVRATTRAAGTTRAVS
jgi:hypothetical protein